MLELAPPPFSIELACLAARREFLNLDLWLADATGAGGPAFLQAVVDFVEGKVREEATKVRAQRLLLAPS